MIETVVSKKKASIADLYYQISSHKTMHLLLSILMIITSAFLQALVLQMFMEPCNLLAGGFTGIALLINKTLAIVQIDFSVSMALVLLNIPAILLCYHYLSKRFTWLSCLQFTLVSLFLGCFDFTPFFTDKTLNVLFGGFLWGCSISLALKAGGSTGGTDFLAQFISNKIHKGIWFYVFFFNCLMLMIFGSIFGWIAAGYSILFQFLSTKTISMLYQQFAQITVEITTCCPDQVVAAFMNTCRHGMSVLQGYGGFQHQAVFLCKSVISSYEVHDVIKAIQKTDPKVIIHTYRTESFYGGFYRKPME